MVAEFFSLFGFCLGVICFLTGVKWGIDSYFCLGKEISDLISFPLVGGFVGFLIFAFFSAGLF